jgi:hypothetical protein
MTMGITFDDDFPGTSKVDPSDTDSVINYMGIDDKFIISTIKVEDKKDDENEIEYRYTFELSAYKDWSVGDNFDIEISFDESSPHGATDFPWYFLTSFSTDISRSDFGIGEMYPPIYRYEYYQQYLSGTDFGKEKVIVTPLFSNMGLYLYSSRHSTDWAGNYGFIDCDEKWV